MLSINICNVVALAVVYDLIFVGVSAISPI